MDDLISRRAAISLPVKPKEDRYFQTQNLDDAYDYGWYSLQACIEKMPAAQPERKKGKWLDTEFIKLKECSCCGAQWGVYSIEEFDFCPSCGAEMRGEQDE